jgi:hypothetical protein
MHLPLTIPVKLGAGSWARFAALLLACLLGVATSCQSNARIDKEIVPDAQLDVVDSAAADQVEADLLPDVPSIPPDVAMQANVFLNNPTKDEWKTSTVTMTNIDDPEGKLTGPYANVFNCIKEEGGWFREYELPLVGKTLVRLCNIKKTVSPDPDGSYLSVEVPEDPLDPNDSFAELMMFFHMNVIHDYYKGTHGLASMESPLEAYVNLMGYIEMETPVPGIPTGWVTFDNAMYIPKESFEAYEELGEAAVKEYLGVEDDLDIPFKSDAIVFMQGENVDFAYDADVIYHEYTHAVVGSDRLWGTAIDDHGLLADPRAINEAYSDYFACTIADDPHAGEYVLGILKGNEVGRDISIQRTCPADYFGEEHLDGLIYSSALWAIREAIGKEAADLVVFNALQTFDQTTSFQEAAEATIAEAALLEPSREAEVEAVFEKHGVLGCNGRVRPWKDTVPGNYPEFVPGVQSTGYGQFANGAPGYLQHEIEVPEGTGNIHLEVLANASGEMALLGGFLGMSTAIKLSVALRRGEPVSYQFDPKYVQSADMVIPMKKKGEGWFALDISGNCLEPGKLYLQFINASVDVVTLNETKLTTSPDPAVKPTFDCKAPDPCEGAPCQATCATDQDCTQGGQCVSYADGCCSACLLECAVCYLEPGQLCSAAEAPPCGKGMIELTEIWSCTYALTHTMEGGATAAEPMVSACLPFDVKLEGTLCTVILGNEPGKLTVQCPECGDVVYSKEGCGP